MAQARQRHQERSPERRRLRTARGELKRAQILDAAARVLSRRGYAGTTLAEIAEEVETGAGSLYYHFDSREELVEEVLRRGVSAAFEESRRAVAALPSAASPLERLQAALRAHLRCVMVDSDYARAAVRSIGQVPPEMWARVNAGFRAYGKFYDGLIAAAMEASEIEAVDRSALRMLILGAVNWTSEWFRADGSSTADEVTDLLTGLVVRGVGRRPAKTRALAGGGRRSAG